MRLSKWDIDVEAGESLQAAVLYIVDDAHDLRIAGAGVVVVQQQMSANWIRSTPIAFCQRLIDKTDQRSAIGIALCEFPAGEQGDSHRSEVGRRGNPVLRLR